MTTRDCLIDLIAIHAGAGLDTIGPLSTLAGDLDLDSLDRIELGLAIEEAFGIPIGDDELDRRELGTVGGLLEFVEDKLSATKLELVPSTAIGRGGHAMVIDYPNNYVEIQGRVFSGVEAASEYLANLRPGRRLSDEQVVNLMDPEATLDLLTVKPTTGIEFMSRLAHEADKSAEKHLRAAFDAGVRAGRCDPDPQAAWHAFKGSLEP